MPICMDLTHFRNLEQSNTAQITVTLRCAREGFHGHCMGFDAFPELPELITLGMRQQDMPPQVRPSEEKYLYFSTLLPRSIKDCFCAGWCPFVQKTTLQAALPHGGRVPALGLGCRKGTSARKKAGMRCIALNMVHSCTVPVMRCSAARGLAALRDEFVNTPLCPLL